MSKGRHKTIPKELKKEMRWIEAQGAKLVLGICESTRHKFSPGHIRLLRKDDAGIKSVAYTGNGIMNFFTPATFALVLVNSSANFLKNISDSEDTLRSLDLLHR